MKVLLKGIIGLLPLLGLYCSETANTGSDPTGLLADVNVFSPAESAIYSTGFSLRWQREPSDYFFAYKISIDTVPSINEHSSPYHTTFIQDDTTLTVGCLSPQTTYYGRVFVCSSISFKASEEFVVTTKICTTGVFTGETEDNMVLIPAGSYIDYYGALADIGLDFFMDLTEVTEYAWDSIMYDSINASRIPKTGISWYDIILFCNKKSRKAYLDTCYHYSSILYDSLGICEMTDLHCDFNAKGYRMPSEDEWEYAYRTGIHTDYFWGKNFGTEIINDSVSIYYPSTQADTLEIRTYAWSSFDSLAGAQPVGLRLPNPWKLYDISGNVSELVWDWFAMRPENGRINYYGPESGDWKIKRGGSWKKGPYDLSGFNRALIHVNASDSYTGFRTVRTR